MKADLDRLMSQYNLDALVVLGDESPNPVRDYLTNRAKAAGQIFKKRGETPVYVVGGMEIDEAAKSGLTVKTFFDFEWASLVKKLGENPDELRREMFFNFFRKLEIKGRVAFYGIAEVNTAARNLIDLQNSDLGIEVVLDIDTSRLLAQAYETKDEHELGALQDTARRACEVVRRTWDFIAGHRATGREVGSTLVNDAGETLTIGGVKRFIRIQEADLNLDNPDGPIFAQGRDAAVPHSHGEDKEALQLGKTIVFDYFPRSADNGYFHDMTRTWCLGFAPEKEQTGYDQVFEIFKQSCEAIKVGEAYSRYQMMTLDFFEARGHKTQRSHPGTLEGYVHSLGHGIGLNVHEAPGINERSKSVVQAGNVITIEPGLYYPDQGWGVRVEDAVYVDQQGNLQKLTDFPYDFILPVK